MNKNESSSNPTGNTKDCGLSTAISVQFDKQLLDTLRARHSGRYCRGEAFFDLLCRMRNIDTKSQSVSDESHTSELHKADISKEPSATVQSPTLFDEPDAYNEHGVNEGSSSYSGRATSDFMSLHCITNYSQLAAAWHWNRQTVLSFLRSLESAGVLLFEQKNKTVEIFI